MYAILVSFASNESGKSSTESVMLMAFAVVLAVGVMMTAGKPAASLSEDIAATVEAVLPLQNPKTSGDQMGEPTYDRRAPTDVAVHGDFAGRSR